MIEAVKNQSYVGMKKLGLAGLGCVVFGLVVAAIAGIWHFVEVQNGGDPKSFIGAVAIIGLMFVAIGGVPSAICFSLRLLLNSMYNPNRNWTALPQD